MANYSGGFVFKSTGSEIGNYVAEFSNTMGSTGGNGIKIKVNNSTPNTDNAFITFEKNDGSRVGRIRGQSLPNLLNSNGYKRKMKEYDEAIALKAVSIADKTYGLAGKYSKFTIATAKVVKDYVLSGLVASAVGLTLGAVAGMAAAHVAQFIVDALQVPTELIDLTFAGYGLATTIREEVLKVQEKKDYDEDIRAKVGITYESGSADYAEWLPKANINIDFSEGDIVGVNKGMIQYETEGAEQLMVISSRPMILGNMPETERENDFEKVAFMGQVPVSILGTAKKGDFILPSGGNNGLGIAVHPENMEDEDYANIVGIAWSDAKDTFSINRINVAVGLQTSTLANQITKQSKEINNLKESLFRVDKTLQKLLNGENVHYGSHNKPHYNNVNTVSTVIQNKNTNNTLDKIDSKTLHAFYKETLNLFDKKYIKDNSSELSFKTSTIGSNFIEQPQLKELYVFSIVSRLYQY
jgi:hypothetical protein